MTKPSCAMKAALLLTALLVAPLSAASGRKIILWDMSAKPPSYRVLQDGKITGPFTGVADGRGLHGEPPLGTIYYGKGEESQVSLPASVDHDRAVTEFYAAIGEYNLANLPAVRHEKTLTIVTPVFDQRTGLVLSPDEAKSAPTYEGFAYLQRPDGSWYALNSGYGNKKNPTPMATRSANATFQTFRASMSGEKCDAFLSRFKRK